MTDILESILKIEEFLAGFTIEEFIQDSKTQFAVVRALEIIGEASKKILNNIKNQFSDLPWGYMAGMRDKLIHDYFGVDANVVWKTSITDLPPLKTQIKNIIENLTENS